MDSGRSEHAQQPGYRPPLAVGQQYPALGYGPDGAPRYTYRPDPDPDAQPQSVQPEQLQYAAPTPPPGPGDSRKRTALGVAMVVLLVLVVAGGLKLMSGGDGTDTATVRDDTPVSQNTTDPYLPKSIEPTDEVPGETKQPAPAGLEADLAVDAAPGSAVLYIDSSGVQLVHMQGPQWRQTIRASTGLLQIRVVVAPGAPASCTITVDGQVVAHEETAEGTSGVLACRAVG
ncbi:hypothetical protein L5G32_16600 [Gordonia sp. HY002]|uniref:hypothetical protein n=1 Tax=Gordonia zhenghanii TaxID=2911516 RepID=UPI001EF03088|nr:hypothetical protein [Gordonia zhenghanii]MCF8571890.1 hypothetical protein [Gordonia zhenghanii]MCF8604397.1 hypothetical protein [Gordonia zhenghanii]